MLTATFQSLCNRHRRTLAASQAARDAWKIERRNQIWFCQWAQRNSNTFVTVTQGNIGQVKVSVRVAKTNENSFRTFTTRMREGDDVRDYLSQFMNIVDKLQVLDIDINGDLLSVMLLHSLPTSFDNFCCAIKSRNNLPDVDALMIKIIKEFDSKAHKGSETGSNALSSKYQHSKKNTSRSDTNTN